MENLGTMWLNFVLLIGILLFGSVVSDAFTCKTIEISQETHNFTVTFLRQYGDQFHNCVWLKSENSSASAKVQWIANLQITLSRYQSACANKSIRIISVDNGDTKVAEIRLNEINNDGMRNKFAKKMLLDLNTVVSIFGKLFRNFLCMWHVQEIGTVIGVKISYYLCTKHIAIYTFASHIVVSKFLELWKKCCDRIEIMLDFSPFR